MWIFLPHGFFSVTEADPERVMVRARARTDLEHLLKDSRFTAVAEEAEIVETMHADYPYRIFTSKTAFAKYLSVVVATLDYSNFKDEVAKTDPKRSHHTYLEVWSVLRQDLDPRSPHRNA